MYDLGSAACNILTSRSGQTLRSAVVLLGPWAAYGTVSVRILARRAHACVASVDIHRISSRKRVDRLHVPVFRALRVSCMVYIH